MLRRIVVVLFLSLLLGVIVDCVLTGLRWRDTRRVMQRNQEKRTLRLIINELCSFQYRNWQTLACQLPEERRVWNRSDRTPSVLSDLLAGRKLLVYVDYRMCKPCVQHNLKLVDSLFYSDYGTRMQVVVYTPGGQVDGGLDLSDIKGNIWTMDKPLLLNEVSFETPCLFLTEDSHIVQVCHSAKNTDMPLYLFEPIVDSFFSKKRSSHSDCKKSDPDRN